MFLSGGCTYKDVFGKFDSIVFYFNAAAHHCLRFTELSRNACSSGRQNNVVRVHEGKQIVLFGLLVRASIQSRWSMACLPEPFKHNKSTHAFKKGGCTREAPDIALACMSSLSVHPEKPQTFGARAHRIRTNRRRENIQEVGTQEEEGDQQEQQQW